MYMVTLLLLCYPPKMHFPKGLIDSNHHITNLPNQLLLTRSLETQNLGQQEHELLVHLVILNWVILTTNPKFSMLCWFTNAKLNYEKYKGL